MQKIMYHIILFVDVFLTFYAINTGNIIGCVVLIFFSITFSKEASPILLKNYYKRLEKRKLILNELLKKKRD
ncbi:hypothetical protein FD15_GL000441 [Liquorilactobacillus sucicola DSM 21376 = JCM 15457]|uniref:Uncharacterized protein n=2 Tax=Liquorilactobacillus sucicola TaxID=519050 RepID=A0A0R2DSA0_9LACO|nr:hypothetical protein FD15_GL000441 [Liquorilactobacillus sucicola DSM 21376 = JCM 15457]